MTKIAQIVRMKAKPGRRQDLIDALAPAFIKAEGEGGTEVYVQFVDAQTVVKRPTGQGKAELFITPAPDEIWYFELYTDDAALKAHDDGYATSPIASRIGEAIRDIIAEPHVCMRLTPIRAKGVAIAG